MASIAVASYMLQVDTAANNLDTHKNCVTLVAVLDSRDSAMLPYLVQSKDCRQLQTW